VSLPRLAVLLLALLAAMPASAQSRPAPRPAPAEATARPAAAKVALQVLVVHATDSVTGVDPRIKGLESSFRYFKYKGYKLLTTQNAEVAPDGVANFVIAGARKVRVTLISVDEARAKLHVEILIGEARLFDTTVNITRGGTFIISGPKHEDGILMLPVRATY
jgi:hypothetical protein